MDNTDKEAIAALFDLDGVIVDTEAQYSKFWSEIGRQYIPDTPGFSANIKGRTLDQIIKDHFGTGTQLAAEIVEKLDQWEKHMKYDFIPGFETFLNELHKHGVKTAVVTSSNRDKMQNLERVHPHFSAQFDRVLTAEDFSESKPSPDGYLKAAAAVGVPIEKCAVFEDSRNGLEAGRRAGMKVVGLATSLPHDEVAAKSDVCIDNFVGFGIADLEALINRQTL